MNNNRPLSKKKTLQLFFWLTILAWATQTLFHQWGFGQEVVPNSAMSSGAAPGANAPGSDNSNAPAEKFIAPAARSAGATLELKSDATVLGADVKLKQICRWSDSDGQIFAPISDLVIARIAGTAPFKTVTLADVRQTLHDAGVNLATINFAGAVSCTITRSDATGDQRDALQQWIDSKQNGTDGKGNPRGADASTRPSSAQAAQASARETGADSSVHTLAELLAQDICLRLNLSPDAIQMNFEPSDQKVLALAEPIFKFMIKPSRMRDLGRVSWDVTIISEGTSKNVTIEATARAWQNELVAAHPLSARQVLKPEDFIARRELVDSLPSDPILTSNQCVGQETSRDITPGTLMTARMVEAVPLVHAGELVTIVLTQGTVQVKTVARATEQGTLGQTIRVRNETTRETFDVTVTGRQEVTLSAQGSGGVVSARD